jgi:phage gpG-like protein
MDRVIEQRQAKALSTRLHGLVGLLQDPEPIWDSIGFSMAENTRMRFTDQKDVDGKRFKPSARAKEDGGQTLLDRGLLRNSITYFSDKHGVEWGVPSSFHYAWILNQGGVIKPKTKPFLCFRINGRWVKTKKVTMPARRFLGLSKADRQEVLDIVNGFLSGKTGPEQIGGAING